MLLSDHSSKTVLFALVLQLCLIPHGGANAQPVLSLANDPAAYINETLKREGIVNLPCGRFVLSQTITMPTGSRIHGAGGCTIIIASPNITSSTEWPKIPGASTQTNMMVTNADFHSGNSRLTISDLTFDASRYARKGHIFGFYRVSDVNISRVVFLGGQNPSVFDGVAFVGSRDYKVLDNTCVEVKTACFDNWGGASNVLIAGNTIVGAPGFSSYGVLMNGINTDDTTNTTRNARIVRNKISSVSQGIFVGGLRLSNGQHGSIEDIIIQDNDIDNVDYHGIRVADGRSVQVIGNTVAGAGRNCLIVGSEGGGGQTKEIDIRRNKFSGCASKDDNSDAVNLYSGASNISYSQNSIAAGSQRYSIRVDSTVSDSRIDAAGTAAGRLGGVRNGGRGVEVVRP